MKWNSKPDASERLIRSERTITGIGLPATKVPQQQKLSSNVLSIPAPNFCKYGISDTLSGSGWGESPLDFFNSDDEVSELLSKCWLGSTEINIYNIST